MRMMLVTIYALYSDDVRVLGFDKSADTTFVVSSSIAFFLFLVEIAVQCWCRDDYIRIPKDGCRDDYIRIPKDVQCGKGATNREKWESFRKIVWIGSFYFWLDLMATLSMIFELPGWFLFRQMELMIISIMQEPARHQELVRRPREF